MKYKTTQKDRYGNMRSLEIDTGENNLEVPPMTSMIPQYEAVGGLAENHPGEPKGSDTVPAWLTPGEFVVNKEAVDMYGPQIKKMNDAGREVQDGNMNPNQAPPTYANEGVAIPVARPSADIVSGIMHQNKFTKQKGIYNHLKNNYPQLTNNAIAGIMGNIGVETGYTYDYETRQNENTGKEMGPGEGLLQFDWHRPYYKKWLNTNDRSDSMASQLDYFMQSIFTKDAVPHPTDASGFAVGTGKVSKLQESLTSNKSPQEIAMDIGTLYQNPKEGSEHYDRRVNKAEEIKGLIDKEAFEPGFGMPPPFKQLAEKTEVEIPTTNPSQSGSGWNLLDFLRGNSSNDNLPENVTTADVNESGVPHVEMPIPELPLSKPKPHEMYDPSADTSAEANFGLNRGGAIHLDPGGLIPGIDYPSEYKDDEWWWGDSRTSSPKPVTNPGFKDYGELIPRLPIDYDPQGTGGMPKMEKIDPAFQNILEQNKSKSVGDSSIMDLIFPPGVQNAETITDDSLLSDLGRLDGSTTRTDMGGNSSLIKPEPTMPFGTIDDMPSEYRPDTNYTPNLFGLLPEELTDSRVSIPMPGSEPKGWVDPLDVPIERIDDYSFADTDMPIDTVEEIGIPRSNTEVSDYENRMEDLLPLEAQTSMADLESLYRDNESPVPEMFSPNIAGSFDPSKNIPDAKPGEDPGYRRSDLPSLLEIDTDLKITDSYGAPKNLDKWHGRNTHQLNKLNKELRDLHNIPPEKRKDSWEGVVAKKRSEIEDLYSETTELERVINQKKLIKEQNKGSAAWKKESQLRNDIQDYEDILNDPAAGAGEKSYAKSKIKELEEKLKEIGGKAKYAESESKLADVVNTNPIDKETEESMYNHWESAKGQTDLKKIYADGDSNPNWNKAKDMLKGTLGFLFGDIFDSRELGRAIAVYLGSRALGYQHGESIGFVSKQYLKRVDAKNTAYDKWLLANSGKYTKKSLSKFKKTRDPAHLFPVGSVPRSQGEQGKWYDKNGKARMAYKFKIKDGAGDDHVYWSWDKSGKSEVEEGWHQDPKSVPGTTEFKAEAKKYRDDIEEQLKALKNQYDIHQNRDDKKGIYTNKYHTDIMPSIDKDDVYNWAINNKVQPDKIGGFLKQAMILATKEARKSDDKPGTILPYLDRVTIDESTRDFPKLMKDGEYELEDMDMVRLNQKITENYGAPTNFYNAAWQEWQKGKRKVDGESWPKVFKELAAKDEANEAGWPPFALFVDNLLHEWMKENATKRHSGDFVLDKAPE